MPAASFISPQLPFLLRLLLPGLILAAFLTETKFVPSIANNIGFFEGAGLLLILLTFTVYQGAHVQANVVVRLVGLLLALAVLSLINLPLSHVTTALIQVSILLFLFLFLLAIYNLCLRFQINPGLLLSLITLSVLIVGPWILAHAARFESVVEAVGPFRNRAHMASYMLTAFWLVAISFFWPSSFRFKRSISYAAMALCLYAVAVSGRRSVYLSLFIGLAALAVAFLAARQGKRMRILLAGLFAVGFLVGLYHLGSEFLPRGDFFRQRVGMIGSRLSEAAGTGPDDGTQSFFALQREGVLMAVRDHPFIGIGWGGFADSAYSPTRHEVHSTPLRFLAETGVLGLGGYLLLIGYLLGRSAQLAFHMRRNKYGPAYLIMTIALWSLSVSWLYNRHITERTFWLLLIIFTLLDAFARAIARQTAAGKARSAARVGPPRAQRRLREHGLAVPSMRPLGPQPR